MRNGNGFTLAEVLVTLAVIGVIASLTIVPLIQSIQEAQYKAAFKKFYSDFAQAHTKVVFDSNGSIKYKYSRIEIKNAHLQYLSSLKSCGWSNETPGKCWHRENEWAYMNGDTGGNMNAPGTVLINGAMFVYYNGGSTCTIGWDMCYLILVDVNGFKGPNIVSKDIFGIGIRENAINPLGRPGLYYETYHPCDYIDDGLACAYKIMTNQDY